MNQYCFIVVSERKLSQDKKCKDGGRTSVGFSSKTLSGICGIPLADISVFLYSLINCAEE